VCHDVRSGCLCRALGQARPAICRRRDDNGGDQMTMFKGASACGIACMKHEAQRTSTHCITPRTPIFHTWGGYTTDRWANIRAGVTHEVTAQSKPRRILELERLSHNLFAVGYYRYNI